MDVTTTIIVAVVGSTAFTTIVSVLISSIVFKRKYIATVDKTEAEAEKLRVEIAKGYQDFYNTRDGDLLSYVDRLKDLLIKAETERERNNNKVVKLEKKIQELINDVKEHKNLLERWENSDREKDLIIKQKITLISEMEEESEERENTIAKKDEIIKELKGKIKNKN